MVGDADELKAAVWNLIDNAVKYSPDEVQVRVVLEETDDESARGPRRSTAASASRRPS